MTGYAAASARAAHGSLPSNGSLRLFADAAALSLPPEWPDHDSEMGRLVRSFSWARTPLGPRSGWPEYLRMTVDTCLSSALPVAICAGPELTMICNDAMMPMLGAHSGTLGQPMYEVWVKLWPTVGPIVDQVMTTGQGAQLTDVQVRCERGDGPEEVFLNLGFTPLREPLGRTIGLSVTAFDVTEQKRSERDLRASEERLRMALEVGELAIWDYDRTKRRYSWSDELFRMLGYSPGEVKPGYDAWASRIHPDDRRRIEEETIGRRGQHAERAAEYRLLLPDGKVRWCMTRWRSVCNAAGKQVRVFGVVQDITERRLWEETQHILIAELQHRTRNLLAVVRSLSAQTLRASDTLEEFARDFNGRLSALSRVQGLLSKGEGQFVRLRDLVLQELAAHGVAPNGRRIVVKGREVQLSAKAVQILTLALHELATNAIKYGALSQPQARLQISWSTSGAGDERFVAIRWSEEDVELPLEVSSRRGFGRELIERAIPYDLGAQTSLHFEPDGVRCEIRLPLRRNPFD